MKLMIVALAVSLCCINAEMYSTRYDTIKLDEMLNNRRLVSGYMKCTLDEGPCTAEGRELKFYISDALMTGCEKCTDRQRKGIKKVMTHLVKHEPGFWRQAVDKFDPDRKYTHKYESVVQSW